MSSRAFVLDVGWLKEWSTTPKTKSREPVVASGQNEDLKSAGKRAEDKVDGKEQPELLTLSCQADFKFIDVPTAGRHPPRFPWYASLVFRICPHILAHYFLFLDITHGRPAVPQKPRASVTVCSTAEA